MFFSDYHHKYSSGQKIILVRNKTKNMSVLIILIAASILVAAGFLIAFIWSVKNGQYDDDYTPSIRMLMDDPKPQDVNPDIKENTATK
jgi:cbb3-type cytochrome oxidase maturation protein